MSVARMAEVTGWRAIPILFPGHSLGNQSALIDTGNHSLQELTRGLALGVDSHRHVICEPRVVPKLTLASGPF